MPKWEGFGLRIRKSLKQDNLNVWNSLKGHILCLRIFSRQFLSKFQSIKILYQGRRSLCGCCNFPMTGRKIVDTSVAVSSPDSGMMFIPSCPMVVPRGSLGGGEAVRKKMKIAVHVEKHFIAYKLKSSFAPHLSSQVSISRQVCSDSEAQN